jgi:hypothetical protein
MDVTLSDFCMITSCMNMCLIMLSVSVLALITSVIMSVVFLLLYDL